MQLRETEHGGCSTEVKNSFRLFCTFSGNISTLYVFRHSKQMIRYVLSFSGNFVGFLGNFEYFIVDKSCERETSCGLLN